MLPPSGWIRGTGVAREHDCKPLRSEADFSHLIGEFALDSAPPSATEARKCGEPGVALAASIRVNSSACRSRKSRGEITAAA